MEPIPDDNKEESSWFILGLLIIGLMRLTKRFNGSTGSKAIALLSIVSGRDRSDCHVESSEKSAVEAK